MLARGVELVTERPCDASNRRDRAALGRGDQQFALCLAGEHFLLGRRDVAPDGGERRVGSCRPRRQIRSRLIEISSQRQALALECVQVATAFQSLIALLIELHGGDISLRTELLESRGAGFERSGALALRVDLAIELSGLAYQVCHALLDCFALTRLQPLLLFEIVAKSRSSGAGARV